MQHRKDRSGSRSHYELFSEMIEVNRSISHMRKSNGRKQGTRRLRQLLDEKEASLEQLESLMKDGVTTESAVSTFPVTA